MYAYGLLYGLVTSVIIFGRLIITRKGRHKIGYMLSGAVLAAMFIIPVLLIMFFGVHKELSIGWLLSVIFFIFFIHFIMAILKDDRLLMKDAL